MTQNTLILTVLTCSIMAGVFYINTDKPRGIRNNNPLNIKQGDNWLGLTGLDGPFIIFESYTHGLRAAGRILRTYVTRYNINSISAIVTRWAPSSENDTQGYIKFVTKKTGIDENKALERGDYPHVLGAMIHMENGQQPYDIADIRKGFEWGFYG
ncbi:virion protein [Pseudoalteromonas sp. MMG013]|uniref:virion protein n=1 Tax=Pseudoalteromonas sp. MMG013 TaxID=2822687 RepID=UPI001B38DBD4|nr:virion protein [Pseudoalteromonas sp. MMG013]MBQ4860347.1 virion protein [Pseudoalteromonas sp. MMG013]